jgi:anti-sigma factor RsiW
MTIDPERLMAYVDGELDEPGCREVERALVEDPALRASLEAQKRLKARLSGHYGPVAGEEVPQHLFALLGAARPEGVSSLADARERRRPRPSWRLHGSIAASLAVGLLVGQFLPSFRGAAPVAVQGQALVAASALDKALDTQLASTQPADAATRIGLTFVDNQGRACRTFEAPSFSGIACRDSGRWAIVATEARERGSGGEYRQAGAPALMARAQEMMAGAPLDAKGELAAMHAGWKIGRD